MELEILYPVRCEDCETTCRATVRLVQRAHYAMGLYVLRFDRTDEWYGWSAGVGIDGVCRAWCLKHRPPEAVFKGLTHVIDWDSK